MYTHFRYLLINVLLLTCLAPGTGFAQPVIEGEDIVNASDRLRDFFYERHELRGELTEVRKEVRRVEARLSRIDELIALQKELDALERKFEALEAADAQSREIRALERRAQEIDAQIELRLATQELDDVAREFDEVIAMLQEDDDPEAHEVAGWLKKYRGYTGDLKEAHAELIKLRAAQDDAAATRLERVIDELSERLERGDQLMNYVFELFEAYGEEDVERIETLERKIRRFEKEFNEEESNRGGGGNDDDADEQTPADESTSKLDANKLPIAIDQQTLATVDGNFREHVVPLLQAFCVDCHGSDTSYGELNLQQMIAEVPIVANRQAWINVIEQTRNRVMPPEDGDELSEDERRMLVLTLHKAIDEFDYDSVRQPGVEPVRRLTHQEYDNTVRDLFGVEISSAARFPSELAGVSGFDNTANTLFLQPLLMERYLSAADEIVATLFPKTPSSESQRVAHRRLFFEQPNAVDDEARVAERILRRFVRRAFRRPLRDEDRQRLMSVYNNAREGGLGYEEAVANVVRTSLISPNFLFKIESLATSERQAINDHELANRLSYFLWASMPDDELFRCADEGRLSRADVLKKQVERMLADEKAKTLGTLFAGQWLGSQHLGTRMRLDPIDNPWCTETLMAAMRAETAMFFHQLVVANEPISKLIDADYTYLNAELAKLYGIRGVRGEQMRRVQLETNQRGGILGQGSLLAVTSFPYRTSPVVRGKWVLDTVLGTPPPPPPPNVSELPEELAENGRLSIRQKLELHREAPNCYACHSQMDPLGLSLEKYDWFGRYRERYGRRRIDDRGTLPNGSEFQGLAGLKQVLVSQRLDDLTRQVSSKMLSYALGRQIEYYDETAIRTIISQVESDDHRFQSLIFAIVASEPFRYRQLTDAHKSYTTQRETP